MAEEKAALLRVEKEKKRILREAERQAKEASVAAALEAEAEIKKNMKLANGETPEQRAARLERQKISKAAKKVADELEAKAAKKAAEEEKEMKMIAAIEEKNVRDAMARSAAQAKVSVCHISLTYESIMILGLSQFDRNIHYLINEFDLNNTRPEKLQSMQQLSGKPREYRYLFEESYFSGT